MSELNRDKDVIEKGRKNSLKNVDAPLRDQIPSKLLSKLNEMNVGEKISSMWSLGNANRSEWMQRQQLYLSDWDEFLVASDEGSFKGASNLHLPMPFIVVKTMHARFLQALLGIDPPFNVGPRLEASADRAKMIEETMEYAIKEWANDYQGAFEALDEWVWQWISTGSGILKQRWECAYTRFVDVETVDVPAAPKSVVDESGVEVLVPQTKKKEREVVRVKKKEFPIFETVNHEDVVMIGGNGNPQRADAVLQSTDMTASELWTLVDRKLFDEDAVEEIIRGGGDDLSLTDGSGIKDQRARSSGKASLKTDAELVRYKIIESYLKMDVDGSGINSDLVVWSHLNSKKLVRANYLYRMNKAGERPFFKIDFHKRKDQDYGIGIVEILHPLSVEMDAIHNMRIDFGLVATMPFGFYRPTSSIDPETISLEPGILIPVENPQTDVYFPNLGNRTSFGFQEEAALQQMVERLTGISDMTLGLLNQQGAARTATGARALLGEASSNLDVHLRRLNAGWKKALEYLLHMLQQRIPEGFSFRLSGDDGSSYWAYIRDREDIEGDFDVEVSPNTSSSNKGIQVENAQQIMQITSDPLGYQLGVLDPATYYEARKNLLSALGVRDYGKFIKAPQNLRVFSPKEEVDRLLRGIPTPVTPEADHDGYLAYMDFLKANPELLSIYTPEDLQPLEQQAMKHIEMLQALESAAAEQRNINQMKNNAATSANQAPTGTPVQGAMNNGPQGQGDPNA
jgi:hypothetical protein